jgi:hypothetical protein
MLFRVILRFINLRAYLSFFFSFLIAKISYPEEDYSRFLEYIFINLIFKPINKIITFFVFCFKMILFILYILLKAIHIVLHFIFIIVPMNIIYFVLSFNYEWRYLFVEFVFMFVDAYVLSFKYHIKSFTYDIYFDTKHLLCGGVYELTEEEYEEYKRSLKRISAPDLKIYYPMRFALSSVMIRLTGVILSISLVLIIFFNFTNIYLIVDCNFNELRRSIFYKFIEFFNNYETEYLKYADSEKYNSSTFYSTIKCIIIIIYLYIRLCIHFLIFDAYDRFELIELLKIKYLTFGFIYNFLFYIFIYILPIHLYYVIYHSYKIISITKSIGSIFSFFISSFKKIYKNFKIFFNYTTRIATLIVNAEEPPVEQWAILIKLKKYEIKLANFINNYIRTGLVNYANDKNKHFNSDFVKQVLNKELKNKK